MIRSLTLVIGIALLAFCLAAPGVMAQEQVSVPVLCYHRFGPTVPDSMTVTTKNFTDQMQWLKDNGYTVIPLKTLVAYLKGEGPAPAPKSVVITVDDGHKTVFTEMQPIVKKFNIPVTLFIYPSCISNPHAPYAMSWEQLKALQQTGLFDMQGHTFWHPNFKKDKKKMKPEEYAKSVQTQLVKSKNVLEKKLGTKIELLAWPYGIYDDYLEAEAQKAGYVMAFSIDRRNAAKDEKPMAQPRYLMQNGTLPGFIAVVSGHAQAKKGKKSEVAF